MSQLELFYLGKQVTDNSGMFKGECVSYIKRYAQELLGVPKADSVLYVKDGKAKNMYLDPMPLTLQYFDRVKTPQRGNIAVYNSGFYGDVAIVLDDNRVIGQLGTPVFRPVAIRPIGFPVGYLRLKGDDMFKNRTAEQWAAIATKEKVAGDKARARVKELEKQLAATYVPVKETLYRKK